ncbi:maleylpyruvate isomerase family mycothiol-dependent enzyme [Streptomyces sp. NPDC059009]|uniref:maleylpyruvate isomerase family mycothiol-dependent enzyme n=1 Tax=Streptomyces sp. NPDC059009 TaxID=3346694 RepID=UPI0036CE680A
MMTSTLDMARLVEGLREQTGSLARAVAVAGSGGAPDLPVPTCPEWTLRTLVGHVGQEHRWAAELVRKGEQLPLPVPELADPGGPEGWSRWLNEGAEELIRAVEGVGADTEVRTLFGPRPAGFWLRRVLSDTCVHHYDAAVVTHSAGEIAYEFAYEIADDLAAEVISETLDLLCTPGFEAVRPGVGELRGRGERIGLRPVGPSGDGWVITRGPGGLSWEHGPVEADVVVSGEVVELMLAMSGRIVVSGGDGRASDTGGDRRVSVAGDRALLDHWLTHSTL